MNLLLKNIGLLRQECRSQIEQVNFMLKRRGKETISWKDPGNLILALFGQYNAGKSTLVNALLGGMRASIGDGPETKVAQEFEWKGYTILDLPGRNARADEDKEALTSLTKAHGVLYVVSSQTGLDYASIWSDLKFLEDQVIPYVLVVNDKQRHQDDVGENSYRNEVIEKFITKAEQQLCKAPSFYWVNARRALEARNGTDRKVLMEQRSGIITLENAVAEFLYRHDDLLRDMFELKMALSSLKQLQIEVANSTLSVEIKELLEQLDWWGQVQEKLKAIAQSMAEEQFNPLRSSIAASYEQAILTEQGKGVQAQVRATITQAWQAAVEAFYLLAQAEINSNKWSMGIWNEDAFFDQFMMDGPDDYTVPANGTANNQLDQTVRSSIQAVGDVLKEVAEKETKEVTTEQIAKLAAKEATRKLTQDSAKKLIQAGEKKVVEQGGKRVAQEGSKNLGKYLGPAIQIATAAWDIYQGYRKAEAEKKIVSAALKKASADADMAVAMIKQLFLGRTLSFTVQQLASLREEANLQLKEAKGAYREEEQFLAELTAHHSSIQTLMDQVSSRCREV